MSDVFADLNEALFAQMDKLQSINPRDAAQMDRIIEQSEAVADLAEKIIDNNNSKVRAMQFFDSIGVKANDIAVQQAKLLGSGE